MASQSKVRVIEAHLLAPPEEKAAPVSTQPVPDVDPVVVEPLADARSSPAPIPVPLREVPTLPALASRPAPAAQEEKRAPAATPPQPAEPAPPAAEKAPSVPAQPEVSPAAPAAAASAYLPVSELDPPPRPLTEIRPLYPPGAGLRAGQVVLDLLIGANGAVEDVKIIEATPAGLFEASAISAFVATRFAPGMRSGVPTAARMRVAVQYSATGMSVMGPGAQLMPSAPG